MLRARGPHQMGTMLQSVSSYHSLIFLPSESIFIDTHNWSESQMCHAWVKGVSLKRHTGRFHLETGILRSVKLREQEADHEGPGAGGREACGGQHEAGSRFFKVWVMTWWWLHDSALDKNSELHNFKKVV